MYSDTTDASRLWGGRVCKATGYRLLRARFPMHDWSPQELAVIVL